MGNMSYALVLSHWTLNLAPWTRVPNVERAVLAQFRKLKCPGGIFAALQDMQF